MVIARADIVWVDFGSPRGSEPAKVRPSIVLQEDWLLATTINTVVVVPLTSNTALEAFPGNVLLPADASGLEKDSVAVVSQLGPVSREFIDPYPAGRVPLHLMNRVMEGIRLTIGL
ncbi:type II toxin-antitoxin system PemK/MazF family toxin [Herbiconiux sp. KACC 21604]|uniref:type II toxin-antitoxin system PemK/MazF family toxin n=1 Tax=unclassified Herbiconiux TaxID=2618217 RepID=UPI0020A257EA|nr:type II toxin-antitoxin system PemK/MazF family toxin [Herbiconiux sp. SALV-R1]WPO86299.1 type II toxin-antitoxin system PemK/MazF family toxin [Herbiconiux sp. KACC 21604]